MDKSVHKTDKIYLDLDADFATAAKKVVWYECKCQGVRAMGRETNMGVGDRALDISKSHEKLIFRFFLFKTGIFS